MVFQIIVDTFSTNTLIGMGVIFVAVVVSMLFVVYKTAPIVPFLYADARVSARSARLLSSDQLGRLVALGNYDELSSSLERSDYSGLIQKQTEDESSLVETHAQLEKWLVNEIETVKGFVTDQLWPIFELYTMMWEARLITAFYRARLADRPLRKELVYAVGEINATVLERLHNAKTTQDLAAVLVRTRYAPVFENDYEDVWDLEVALDDFIIRRFGDVCRETKLFDSDFMIEMLKMRFDIINIMTTLKLGIVESERRLIPTGTDIERALRDFNPEEDREEKIAELLKYTCFGAALARALSQFEDDKHYYHFETELYREYLAIVKKDELLHYQGPFPIFVYLMKREFEVRNIMAISKALYHGYDADETRGLLIV